MISKMGYFSNFDKLLAHDVLEGYNGGQLLLYNSFKNIFCDKAVFFFTGDDIILFCSQEEQSTIRMKFVSVLSLLTRLEHDGFVFCAGHTNIPRIVLKAEVHNCAKTSSSTFNYEHYFIDPVEKIITDENGEVIYQGFGITDGLRPVACHFLLSDIYPTESLVELSKNKYVPIEKRSLKSQIRIAIGSSVLAVVVAVLSFCSNIFMTYFNNDNSYTEIKSTQYNAIYNVIQKDSVNLSVLTKKIINQERFMNKWDSIISQEIKSKDKKLKRNE